MASEPEADAVAEAREEWISDTAAAAVQAWTELSDDDRVLPAGWPNDACYEMGYTDALEEYVRPEAVDDARAAVKMVVARDGGREGIAFVMPFVDALIAAARAPSPPGEKRLRAALQAIRNHIYTETVSEDYIDEVTRNALEPKPD